MVIKFVDLFAQYQEIKNELDNAALNVLASCQYILGNEVSLFEKEFADYCGAPYCVGVGNGLEALTLLLKGSGIGPGDEVITQANTFIATIYSILATGAKPVLVDCLADTMLMDVTQVEAAITSKTKAIIPVHLYGQYMQLEPVISLARKYNLVVLEDAAQVHGAYHSAEQHAGGVILKSGAQSDGASYSFYPGKNLGCAGDGGAAVTKSEKLANFVSHARNYGQSKKYHHDTLHGTNSRLDTMQAAILRVKLRRLDAWNNVRRACAAQYHELLTGLPLSMLPLPKDTQSHVWHLFPIVLESPEQVAALQAQLQNQQIESGIHYPVPVHLQTGMQGLFPSKGAYPVSEYKAQRLLSLPIHPHLTSDHVSRICEVVRSFY